MKVKVFGQLQDVVQNENILIEEVNDLNSFREKLFQLYPELSKKKFAIAVDKTIVNENITLTKNDEIALLPPFSGG